MSKRLSSGQSNTLFNYFQSPNGKPKLQSVNGCNSPSGNAPSKAEEKRENDANSDDDVHKPKKRNRLAIVDSDSDSENNKSLTKTPSKKPANGKSRVTKKAKIESDASTDEENDTAIRKKVAVKSYSFAKHSDKSDNTQSGTKPDTNGSDVSTKTAPVALPDSDTSWAHNKLDFLKPDKIRDINKNLSNHPDYDDKTLYVPEQFLNAQTPAMRQWWILKSKHLDSVLFFKVGKFYELYHMDAVIGVNHLGFSYMKGDFAHSGFPESAYGKMASSLVEQGFKVARVEQTETPEMMAERCKTNKGKFSKVVAREICQITTKATCIYGAQMPEAKFALPCYMLAIAEKPVGVQNRFGVCFIDTSIGTFHLADFSDDKHCSRLLALLAQHPPGMVLTERGRMQKSTQELLKISLGNVRRENLASESQFYSAQSTLEKLRSGCYFTDKSGEFQWPAVLEQFTDDGSPKKDHDLAIKALGACMWYLKDSELDIQILSMKKFEVYHPVDTLVENKNLSRNYMVLDSVTMENLKILGGLGTLQKTLDHCETAFGKRLLQYYLCRPLCDANKIVERQKAVNELYNNPDKMQRARAILKKLPDLERQVAKIHVFGNRFCAKDHPDSRAIFYEAKTYSKRKIFDLLNTLRGFEKAQEITDIFTGCESRLLKKITQKSPSGKFLDLTATLQYFKDAFDQKEAEKEGKIIPQPGIDQDFDQAEENIAKINRKLDVYLTEQKNFFGAKVTYFGSDKKRYQLDVPDHKTHKVTSEYQLEGTKKGAHPSKRYSTATTRQFLADMLKAENERSKIVHDLNRRIFEKFSDRYQEWEQVTHCLMILDVLCSFAEYARTYSEELCLPKLLPGSETPVIKIENGRHPCILNIDSFVPNETVLGTEDNPSIMLLTGPNMGGKSTLMRQVALISIMAQMGSFVPASSCEITLIDRIFTRLGAYDDILYGQSTFLVELTEASAILQHATRNSFVLLDELGRGTSTHDGNAIATAYVRKLTEINCRTIFSTHYHTLVDRFADNNLIQLGHMACMVENENSDDATQESVTFLYKLASGSCPKSYGFNAAKLAGLPDSIIVRACEVAKNFENIARNRKLLSGLFLGNTTDIRAIISSVH